MATNAALQLHPRLQPATVPPGSGRPPRPNLRVLEGGRAASARAQQRTFLRRRLLVAVVAAGLLAVVYLLAGAALAGTAGGGSPSAAAGATSPAAAVHVVQPGDTLWSIAAAAAPDVDVRVTVDRLSELNGRGPLVVGQRLVLPE